MKSWRYIEPTSATDMTPVEHVLTENEILEQTYPWWVQQVMKANARRAKNPRIKPIPITPLGCIEDFVVTHWASPVPPKVKAKP